jgi:hypothetical protein
LKEPVGSIFKVEEWTKEEICDCLLHVGLNGLHDVISQKVIILLYPCSNYIPENFICKLHISIKINAVFYMAWN